MTITLTPEQEKQAPLVKKEWTDLITKSGKDLTKAECEEYVQWLYGTKNLSMPMIYISDSYLGQKFMLNIMEGMGEDFVNLRKALKAKTYNAIDVDISQRENSDILEYAVNQLVPQLAEYFTDHKLTKSEFNRRASAECYKACPEKIKYIDNFFGISHDPWIAYYDFFLRMGHIDKEEFKRYRDFLAKGVWNMVTYDTACFIAKLPTKINMDESERLHGITEPAIKWRDGSAVYFIHGVKFAKELWTKVTNKTLSVKEVLTLENMEQRYIALSIYDPEEVIKQAGGVKIDSWREYQLYAVDGMIPDRTLKCMKYKDPSTDRIYCDFVPDATKTCREAKAWKFHLKEDQLDSIVQEA